MKLRDIFGASPAQSPSGWAKSPAGRSSSGLLSRAGQSAYKLGRWRSASNESSSILHLPTSPTHSLRRHAKSFSTKTMSLSPNNNNKKNISNTKKKGAAYSSGRSRRLLQSGESSSSGRSDEEVSELQEVFAYFDGDGDGKISAGELRSVLKSLGEEMSEGEVRGMMEAVDSDGDGFIDLHDFIRLNTQICREEEEELLEAFRMLDTEKGGFITPNSLRQLMLRLLGEQTTLDDCVLMIKPFDLDGDGLVSFHEFKRMMTA